IWRIASTMFWPCETRTSTCRSFATISSGLYRFLAIAVLLDVKDIPQVGPLQWGWITQRAAIRSLDCRILSGSSLIIFYSNRCFGKGGEQTWISPLCCLQKIFDHRHKPGGSSCYLHMVGSGEHGQLCVR